ncbi:RNA polymerase sigma-70 factor [Butyricimonas faecihominis]|uniref:RNA polymerase sigma-70 factor n=1 Tax=Butyricimonas faecihominis TaxID=1472416 RepID=UPI0032C01052
MSKRSSGRINDEYYMANELLDNKIFEDLFELHFTKLMGFVFNYVRDEEVAKDIVHDAFLTLWSNRKRLNPVYPVKSYLFTLAQNCALNYLRHLRVVTGNEQTVTELLEAANEELDDYEKRLVRLEEKLAQLPEKQREVLVKCVVEGKKYKEVAEELDITVNTVKTHITRALKFLRDELQEDLIMLLWCLKRM